MREGQKLILEEATYIPVKLALNRYAWQSLSQINCYVLYNKFGPSDDIEFIVVPFDQAYRLFKITPADSRVVAIMNAKEGFQFSTDLNYR